MNSEVLDINNVEKRYLDEKELFILYSLLKRKHISTMWSNVFVPNNSNHILITSDADKDKSFEEKINNILKRNESREQSPIVFSYLLKLGKQIDEKGYSLFCNADYSLIEGGFLTEDMREIMYDYLEDKDLNKKSNEKYKQLNKEQIDFLSKPPKDDLSYNVELTKFANLPVKEYREAILNKEADADFIELVNKLITPYDHSKWDTEDVTNFLEIYYRHNKESFHKNKNMPFGESLFYKDNQTKLANLIFESTDIHLSIKNTKKLEEFLSNYIELFKNDKLNGSSRGGLSGSFFAESSISIPLHTKLYGFKKQREILLKHITDNYEKYKRDDLEIGNPFTKPEYIGNDEPDTVKITIAKEDENEEMDLFLFVHTILALEYEKYLEIEDFYYGKAGIFDLYDRGFIFKIKLKNNKENTAEQKILSQNKARNESVPSSNTIKIFNDYIVYSDIKVPVKRGQKAITKLFIDNANIYRGDILYKKGKSLEIKTLMGVGDYKDENAFRDGLKRLRAKVSKLKISVTIENPTTGKYQMFIKYQ